jgi:hypothetical protein
MAAKRIAAGVQRLSLRLKPAIQQRHHRHDDDDYDNNFQHN